MSDLVCWMAYRPDGDTPLFGVILRASAGPALDRLADDIALKLGRTDPPIVWRVDEVSRQRAMEAGL